MAKRKSKPYGRYAFGGLFVLALLVAGVLLAFYSFYLDFIIRSQFEARRWELPSRVMASPLELYPGLQLDPAGLEEELDLLHYQANSDAPGSYRRKPSGYLVHTRGFQFWDGQEAERRVRVEYEGTQIAAIVNVDTGQSVDLLRLEPVQIASIYPSHNDDRILVKLGEVPKLVLDTLVEVEDRRYYQHFGLDLPGVLRAIVVNLKAGQTVQGASTLTQQLVRNLFLNNDRNLWRKFNEAIMAVLVELHYSKEQILETYINEVYLGQDGDRAIHGFALASQFYFDRRLQDLSPDQVAMLVALVKGPSYYSPRRAPQRAKERRDLVLSIMGDRGILPPLLARSMAAKPLGVTTKPSNGVTPFPAFLDLVRQQLSTDYREEDLRSEGLVIYTSMDPLVQARAERALRERLVTLERDHRMKPDTLESATVVTSVDNGEVYAVVGGRDAAYAGYNRAMTARRPIGSLVKPIVYLTALSHPDQYTLATPLEDTPFSYRLPDRRYWTPENYDRKYRGQVLLNEALTKSLNVPTARLGLAVGVDQVLENLQRLGLQRNLPIYPSLLLGAGELSPLEISQIYQSIASGGYLAPLTTIREVLDRNGKPLQRYPLKLRQVADPSVVYLVLSAMHEVTQRGTATALTKMLPGLDLAGKTGTTDGLRDSWFAGFSGQHLIVTWVGRDDNKPTGLSGATGALLVWADIMGGIATRPLRLAQPDGDEWKLVDTSNGLLADENCPNQQWLPFVKGSAPRQFSPCASSFRSPLPPADAGPDGQPAPGGWQWLKRWAF